jgi:GT2 family glycosyltransferase
MTASGPEVAVIIPTYRDLHLVERGLGALMASQCVSLDILVVNNDPDQDVAGLASRFPVRVIDVGHNTGFMGAINRGIRATTAPYVLFHNADLEVTPEYAGGLARWLESHPEAAIASGKVLRREHDAEGRPLFDTAGIALRRSLGAYDRGEGQPDAGRFEVAEEVFGVSGAACLARRSALDDVAEGDQVLDESFFMYKDDIDLCWRLRSRGWACWYVPSVVAYHERTGRGLGGANYLRRPIAYLRNERQKRPGIRQHSLKNQWLILLKNADRGDVLRCAPSILLRELMVVGGGAVVSPLGTLRGLAGFARHARAAIRKRHASHGRRVVRGVAAAWAGRP